MNRVNINYLHKQLGYQFSAPELLEQALTHRSVGSLNNERLEFLGDSILSFVISNALFELFPEEGEGKLSRLRAFLVKGDTLAEIAREIDLGDYLILGQGELKSGGFRRDSILADSLEAVFAAVYLDSDMHHVSALILRLFDSRLHDPGLNHSLKDAKTQLQELLQSKKMSLPEYELTTAEGEEHDQVFHVKCHVRELNTSIEGTGRSRRKAEQDAAYHCLKFIRRRKL